MQKDLFDPAIAQEELIARISQQASLLQRHRKVLDQYRLVFEQELQSITAKYRKQHSAGKSLRLALVDPEHAKNRENKLELKKVCAETKVAYECNRLLAAARQSLNSYYQQTKKLKFQRRQS